jgi:hypothetical protein
MVGTLENPTLDLNPALPETLDVITATRAGTATFTDVNGNIASAPANTVRVDQTQGAELTPTKFQRFVNTEFDQAYWSFSSQMGNPVYNYDTAPNGEQEATRIVSNGGSYPQIVETITGLTVGQEYTASFYVKSDGTSQIQQATHFTGLSGGIGFTPTDNWERASYTITATATTHNFVIFTNSGSAPASSYLIWGPQVEEGTTASSFVENTTGSPKFITGPTFGPRVPMILVEPSAINQTKQSEDFNSSEWTHLSVGQGSTPIVTDNFDYSPDGTQNATRLQVALNGGNTVTDQSIIYDIDNSNTVQTISVWMKSNTNEAYNIYLANTYTGTGTDIAQVTPQWQRFSFSHTTSNHTFSLGLRGGIGSSDSADILIWGAQGEAGSVATSYIPTAGGDAAARTRAADNLEITGSAFTDFYNQSEGTFYVESELQRETEVGFEPFLFDADNGDANRVLLYNQTAGDVLGLVKASGAGYAINLGTHPSVNTLSRTAFSYKSNNLQGSKDGNSVTPITTAVIPSTINTLNVGSHYTKAENLYLNGRIRRLIFWPYHSDSL